MSDDALSLLACLEERFGSQIQVFEGVVYFRGWRLDVAKLEADFLQWRAQQQ